MEDPRSSRLTLRSASRRNSESNAHEKLSSGSSSRMTSNGSPSKSPVLGKGRALSVPADSSRRNETDSSYGIGLHASCFGKRDVYPGDKVKLKRLLNAIPENFSIPILRIVQIGEYNDGRTPRSILSYRENMANVDEFSDDLVIELLVFFELTQVDVDRANFFTQFLEAKAEYYEFTSYDNRVSDIPNNKLRPTPLYSLQYDSRTTYSGTPGYSNSSEKSGESTSRARLAVSDLQSFQDVTHGTSSASEFPVSSANAPVESLSIGLSSSFGHTLNISSVSEEVQNVQAFQESSSLPFVHANQCSTSSAKNFDLFPVDPRMKIDARIINNHSVDFGCLERDRLNCELLEEQKQDTWNLEPALDPRLDIYQSVEIETTFDSSIDDYCADFVIDSTTNGMNMEALAIEEHNNQKEHQWIATNQQSILDEYTHETGPLLPDPSLLQAIYPTLTDTKGNTSSSTNANTFDDSGFEMLEDQLGESCEQMKSDQKEHQCTPTEYESMLNKYTYETGPLIPDLDMLFGKRRSTSIDTTGSTSSRTDLHSLNDSGFEENAAQLRESVDSTDHKSSTLKQNQTESSFSMNSAELGIRSKKANVSRMSSSISEDFGVSWNRIPVRKVYTVYAPTQKKLVNSRAFDRLNGPSGSGVQLQDQSTRRENAPVGTSGGDLRNSSKNLPLTSFRRSPPKRNNIDSYETSSRDAPSGSGVQKITKKKKI